MQQQLLDEQVGQKTRQFREEQLREEEFNKQFKEEQMRQISLERDEKLSEKLKRKRLYQPIIEQLNEKSFFGGLESTTSKKAQLEVQMLSVGNQKSRQIRNDINQYLEEKRELRKQKLETQKQLQEQYQKQWQNQIEMQHQNLASQTQDDLDYRQRQERDAERFLAQ